MEGNLRRRSYRTRNSLLVLNDASYEAYLERVGSENEDNLTAEQFQYFRNNTATGLQ